MAKFLFSLLLIPLLASSPIEARESRFFSKPSQHDTLPEAPATPPALAPAPEPEPRVTGDGHGLYGHVSNDELNELETKLPAQTHNEEETMYNGGETSSNEIYNSNNAYGSYEFDNRYNDRYESHGYAGANLGMSDSRLWGNGKYYAGFENGDNHYNGYGAGRGISGKNEGYYGNSENHEFDTMEEYERQQGYSQIQGEYFP